MATPEPLLPEIILCLQRGALSFYISSEESEFQARQEIVRYGIKFDSLDRYVGSRRTMPKAWKVVELAAHLRAAPP